MVSRRVRMILGVVVGAVLPVAHVMAQEAPTVVRVTADSNGNYVATQTLPDGTVKPLDLKQNGIVIDPGDVGREFTLGDPATKGSKAGGQQVDVNQLRQQAAARFAETLKQELACTDEEWSVLGPKIEAIRLLQSVLGEGPGALGDKSATGTTPNMIAVISDLRARQADFRRSVTEQFPEQETKSRMTALRESRDRARQELMNLRKELTALLTIHQEAVLLQRRILD